MHASTEQSWWLPGQSSDLLSRIILAIEGVMNQSERGLKTGERILIYVDGNDATSTYHPCRRRKPTTPP